MAATSTTESWDAAWTLTGRAKRKRLTDNISDSYPTLKEFRKSGVMEIENGGKEIQEDLMYALNTSQWFDGYDVLNTDAVDGVTAAFYNFRYNVTPITISMTEETEARKAEGAMKLTEVKMQQSMTTAFDTLNAALHGAQSGKSILGLQNIVSSSSGATIGGIDSSAETWWDNTRFDYHGTYSTGSFKAKHSTYTDMYNGILAMRDLWNSVSEGNDTPKLILTSYEVGASYEAIFEGTGYTRLTPRDANDMDGSGTAFRSARVIMDRDCAYSAGAGVMYFLQPKYLKFKVQAGKNFAKTPYKEPANQLAKVAYVVFGGQLVTNHRARQGVLYNVTV